jgi:phytoene dehydrogenase-like protein
MGAITQAMVKAAAARGVDIRLSTRVRQVLVENGQAIGVETDKGETIRAAAVAAGINPKLLYLHLVDARALPEGFRRRMENWRCGSGTFRMNVALSELPDFTALPGRALAEHHASGIIIAPSLAYMEQAYFDARSFGWSRRPIIELVIPSTLDGTLAPRGQHVASLFCQHVAPKLADGSSWDDHRETVADLMIETVNDHAPNFRRSVLARQIFSPLDSTRVRQVLVENGRAIGVETDKSETIRAAAVAAGINPKLLYLHLVDARALPEGFRRRLSPWLG